MFTLVLAVILVVVTGEAGDAITWTFEHGSTQGWVAYERSWRPQDRGPLRWEMIGGLWRVHVNPYSQDLGMGAPTVELISPQINAPVELFDRLEVRARLIHDHGIQGVAQIFLDLAQVPGIDEEVTLFWDTPAAGSWSGRNAWDQFAVPLTPPDTLETEVAQSALRRVRLVFELAPPFQGSPRVSGPEDVPAAVEVDWIRLTGRLEQAQGELPPPGWEEQLKEFGELFGRPRFSELGSGTGANVMGRPGGALGDVDGNGTLDLIAANYSIGGVSWMLALNDATGGFVKTYQSSPESPPPYATLADVVGSGGACEIVLQVRRAGRLRVELLGWVGGAWETRALRDSAGIIGVGDVDGDGRHDLLLSDSSEKAAGYYSVAIAIGHPGEEPRWEPWAAPSPGARCGFLLWPSGVAGRVGGLWFGSNDERLANGGFPWYLAMYRGVDGALTEQPVFYPGSLESIRHIGDIDGDGFIDMIVAPEFVEEAGWPISVGLSVARNPGDGKLQLTEWRPQARMRDSYPCVADVNGDGLMDVIYVHYQRGASAVMVNLGRPAGQLPAPEGVYCIEGQGGDILAGDVDNDGDVDLVVLEPERYGTGGVYVLKNTGLGQSTAVTDTDGQPMPGRFRVAPNYPNPFNAGTTVPIHLDRRSAVSLTIYNVAGQCVRRLDLGALTAGVHSVHWDGRNDAGDGVSSGVYFAQVTTPTGDLDVGRMVRVE